MLQDELDWMYHNRDRVTEDDWWRWVDSVDHIQAVDLAQWFLSHLEKLHRVPGNIVWQMRDIAAAYASAPLHHTQRQHRWLMAAMLEHWSQIDVYALA
jgi:hypothetical protein